MHPILVKIGPITIHTYGFLLAVGVMAAVLLTVRLTQRENLEGKVISDFIFFTILVGLLGAKLWLFITEIGYYLRNPGQIPSLLTSAGAFYGGLIFGLFFALWFLRRHRLNPLVVADAAVPGLALAHFFGRMGCFAAGCCWGREAEGCSAAVQFNDTAATTGVPLGISLYPTQVMEACLNLLNFVVLFILYKKKTFKGQILLIYIFNYSVIRLLVEFFRGDGDRGYLLGGMERPFSSISVPQLVSIIGIIVSLVLYARYSRKHRQRVNEA